MAVTTETSAPYAPASAIISLIERHRNRGLPSPVNADVLERAGVSHTLIPRTMQALQVLDLIGEDGAITDTFEGIRRVPESEYRQRLAEWLRATYADVFKFVDPMTDDEMAVRDAFRSYRPVGQQSRMVGLFLALCGAAGIVDEKPTAPRPHARRTTTTSVSPSPRVTPKKPTKGTKHAGGHLPAALAGLLESLPSEGDGWSKSRRDGFYATFGTVLDFCFPITEDEEAQE